MQKRIESPRYILLCPVIGCNWSVKSFDQEATIEVGTRGFGAAAKQHLRDEHASFSSGHASCDCCPDPDDAA